MMEGLNEMKAKQSKAVYLDTCFRERYPKGDFLPEKNVGIMRFLEEGFQFLELLRRERRPIASLLEKVITLRLLHVPRKNQRMHDAFR